MKKSKEERVLEKYWEQLKDKKGVLSVRLGHKFVDGKDTGQLAVIVYVKKKLPLSKISKKQLVPSTLEGIATDVIELKAKDFTLGETSMSKKSPEEQRRLAGGVKR